MGQQETTEGFDTNFNMRINSKDRDEFYRACARNGEPEASAVVRRMMADYTEGNISYTVNQNEEV